MGLNGHDYNNLQYYNTSTGRWSGRGFYLHNFPRASVADPEDYSNRFFTFRSVTDFVILANAVINPEIIRYFFSRCYEIYNSFLTPAPFGRMRPAGKCTLYGSIL
jgi:hypothetical protein